MFFRELALLLYFLVISSASPNEEKKFKMFNKLVTITEPGQPNKDYYVMLERTFTWYESYQLCESFGMELAIVDTEYEERQVVERLNLSIIRNWVWIGGVDTNYSEIFYWAKTGEPIRKNMIWHPTEPNSKAEHCLLFWKPGDSYVLGNHHCDVKGVPLCRRINEEELSNQISCVHV